MKKFALFAMLVLAVVVLAAACAPAPTPVPTAAPPTAAPKPASSSSSVASSSAAPAPTAAPSSSAASSSAVSSSAASSAAASNVVEESKKENALVVYSIMSASNWKPVIEGFSKKYPWIKVENVADLSSNEIFPRYYSESASKAKTADLIITTNPDGWQDFIAKGESVAYKSTEDAALPAWSKLAPGIYTVSSDPLILIWNKQAVPNGVKSLADLAALIDKDPAKFQGKITTYDAETNATGFAANWFWMKKKGEDGWKIFESIAKAKPKLGSGAGAMVDDTLSGAISVGYFVSGINAYPKYPAAEPVMGNAMIADVTPLIVRGMGLTKSAKNSNSAKLMMDYILSQEGQLAFAEGGLTAYRPDVADKAKLHLNKLSAAVGEQNLAPFYFDKDIADPAKVAEFKARWKKLFKP
ncbi:MAG: substrate-binding domain-containing protein [Chloroflexi bacterium]|nr:substrate-binding domain-containing protein [Chloroflexota bacterium]